jgi:NADH-quinone oxidoreductase subunit N
VNPSDIATSQVSALTLIVPEMILGVAACVLILGATFRPGRHLWGGVALLSLAFAGLILAGQASSVPTLEDRQTELSKAWLDASMKPQGAEREQKEAEIEEGRNQVRVALFTHSVLQSRIGLLTRMIAIIGGIVLVLASWNDVSDRLAPEYHACLLVIVAGLGLTGATNDLITLFLALELISIPTYILLYLQKTDRPAQEAAAKYFLLSVFSSGLLLFGFSYLYGVSGTTNIPAILDALRGKPTGMLTLVAVVMVVAGLGFKITAVPFHFYAPDVYQGASTTAAALLAFVPKVAGFVALLRVLGFISVEEFTSPGLTLGLFLPSFLFGILATITMCLGNVMALLQDNLKRILAYSSVAHAGYMLIGLAAAPGLSLVAGKQVTSGSEAILFYLVAYGSMTLGAFAVITYLSTPERPVETIDDLAGLGSSHPGVAALMALFLFSLIGMPATAGFIGKFLLFFSAMGLPADTSAQLPELGKVQEYATRLRYLALIGAINAAAAGWYYLRIVAAMYLRTPLKPLAAPASWPGLAAVCICAALTLGLGVYPKPLVEAARAAAVFPERTDSAAKGR